MKKCLLISLLFSSVLIQAQSLVTVSGTQISISLGADVFIDGSIKFDTNSNVNVDGNLNVLGNIESFGTLNQSGQIALLGNWSNNGIYVSTNSSLVNLIGDNQVLGGDSVSNFGQLACETQGFKELGNTITAFNLNLGDCVFNTHEFSLLIRNPATSSLSFLGARVLSELNGQLRRNVEAGSLYFFPVGDATSRWQVEYQSINSSQIGVRYASVDANSEDLSRFQVSPELCGLSDIAYIRMYDLPSPSGGFRLRFPSVIAADFPKLCVREVGIAQAWNVSSAGSSTIAADTATFTVIPTTSNLAYILGRLRPELPQIIGEDELCQLTAGAFYSVDSVGTNTLIWTVSGGEIENLSTSSISVNWTDVSTGLVSVVSTDIVGCSSLPGNLPIVLNPLPTASIGVVEPVLPFENEYYNLYSESNSDFYSWQLESGQSYSDSSIFHRFPSPGIYPILLQVENEFGCFDTARVTIEILEGLILSNVITPNGDGINDYFELPNSGIIEYNVAIFNRWGVAVFESSEAKSAWDGRDASGQLVNPGTYFYVLEAKSTLIDYSKKGSLQVIY